MERKRLSLRALPVVPNDFDVQPEELLTSIARLIATWPGVMNPDTPFLCAANPGGSKPPIFWVMQSRQEFETLSATLPSDQPLYALKSVYMGEMGFSPQDAALFMVSPFIEAVSAAFMKDIQSVAGAGPIVLGGNCTGSVSALDMAIRAETPPDTLILMNYPIPPKVYTGRMELLFGEREWGEFQEAPENSGCFPNATINLLEGKHGSYFRTDQIYRIVEVMSRSAARAV